MPGNEQYSWDQMGDSKPGGGVYGGVGGALYGVARRVARPIGVAASRIGSLTAPPHPGDGLPVQGAGDFSAPAPALSPAPSPAVRLSPSAGDFTAPAASPQPSGGAYGGFGARDLIGIGRKPASQIGVPPTSLFGGMEPSQLAAATSANQPTGPAAPGTPPAQAHPAFNPVTGPAVNPGDQAQRMSWAAQSSYRPMADAEVAQYDALMARQHLANEQSIAATGAPQWSPRQSPWSGGSGVPIHREGAMTQYMGGNQDPSAALARASQSARTPEELIALSNASTGREHAAAQAEMYRGEAAKNFEQARNPMGLAPGIDPHAVTEAKLQMPPGSSTHHDYNDIPSLDAWSRQAEPTVSGMRAAIAGGGLNQHDPKVMAMIRSMLSTKFPDLSGTYHENDGPKYWGSQSDESRENQSLLVDAFGKKMFGK